MEKFADEIDRASALETMANEEGVRKVLRRMEKPPSDFDGTHCVECGEPIPEKRLSTGAFRDIYCQQRIETMRKLHRSGYE